MKYLNVILQAVIQGLTEFLPVSSSGHLSLYQHFTGRSGEGALLLSVFLHLGTLVAVFIAFRDTIWALIKEFGFLVRDVFTGKFKWSEMNGERRLIFMLVFSTAMLIPFYFFKSFFEGISQDTSIMAEGFCFLYTSAILFMSDKFSHGKKLPKDITVKDSIVVGAFQGVALLPGVSRSGSTISSGLLCGFSRDTAVRYAFILGIPAILGGGLLEAGEAVRANVAFDPFEVLVGFVVAAVVGLASIKMVSWLLKSDKFKVFAIYTLVLGIAVIGVSVYELATGNQIVINI